MVKKINCLKCQICGAKIKKEENNFFPFCSSRCKDADLYFWLTGKYKISSPLKKDDEDITPLRG